MTGERAPGTHRIEGWVYSVTSLNAMETRNVLVLSGIELCSSVIQPVS